MLFLDVTYFPNPKLMRIKYTINSQCTQIITGENTSCFPFMQVSKIQYLFFAILFIPPKLK